MWTKICHGDGNTTKVKLPNPLKTYYIRQHKCGIMIGYGGWDDAGLGFGAGWFNNSPSLQEKSDILARLALGRLLYFGVEMGALVAYFDEVQNVD